MRNAGLGAGLTLMALVLLAAPAAAEWVDWIAEGAVRVEFNDNVNVSSFDSDTEWDVIWRPGVRLGRVYQLADSTRLSMAAVVDGAAYMDFGLLSEAKMRGELALTHKFGVGANQPWVRAHVASGYRSIQDIVRSSIVVDTGLEVGKRFHPRLDGSIAYLYSYRDGRDGGVVVPTIPTNVWDQQNHQVTAKLNFLVWDQLLLSAAYTYRDGEFDSSCTVGNVGTVLRREGDNVKAITVNNVFGGCVYRLGGHVNSAAVALNYGIGERWAIEAGYRFHGGKARELNYKTNIASLSVLFRY